MMINVQVVLESSWDGLEMPYVEKSFTSVFFKTCLNSTLQSYTRVTTELSFASRSSGYCCCKGLVSCLPSRRDRERERVLQILEIFDLFWRTFKAVRCPTSRFDVFAAWWFGIKESQIACKLLIPPSFGLNIQSFRLLQPRSLPAARNRRCIFVRAWFHIKPYI